ncbi:MAG: Gfo/Idh/MocA family oxidoreductase [candidate division Zixibacteria bacterium]|nr:Gfo/Idh/MocA family oxidoreductase [candidate division Zixibacteria bacterium]
MSQVRIGIIGAGGMGNHHTRELTRRPDTVVTAMCDTSEASMDRLVETMGAAGANVHRYNSVDALLAREKLDGVIIATPHTHHAEQVRACLKAGLHVLCEKPMATTAKDARDFIAWSEESKKILAVAYQRHGDGKFMKARELIQEGYIGDVRLIHVVIAQDCLDIFKPGASWRADPVLSGGGHFMDTGSHINDIMLWTTGLEPQKVHAFINQEGTLVDVVTAVAIEFTNGGVGSMSFTSLSPEWREEFTFYGTEGTMRFGAAEPLRVHRRGEDIILPRTPGSGKTPALNFIDAILGLAPVQAPPICGLRVAQLTEAAYKSAQSGKPEPVG